MAERDFYNVNSRISYPLVVEDSRDLAPSGVLPNDCLVDAGFIMGASSEYEIGTHHVLFYGVTVTGANVIFDFRDTATGTYRFLFTIPLATPFGAVCYAGASLIGGGAEDATTGYGYIVIGQLSTVIALGEDVYTASGSCRVEPGLIQSEYDTAITEVLVANAARCCPDDCTNEASSSSSSSPDNPCDIDVAYLNSTLTGPILFKEGYNMTIVLNETLNAVQFEAQLGYGEGQPCTDIRVTENGDVKTTEWCAACDEYIQSINGQIIADGKLVISGGNGISIETDPDNFQVIVRLNSEYYCEV
jgi:hypothetical protein